MPATLLTPNMGLVLPTPTVQVGPLYASQNNAAFTAIDSHNHTTGYGVPVPCAGININSDLPFNGWNASGLRSTRLVSQASPLATASDLACLYASGGNLYYNNASGQAVQITAGAALNATSIGGIGGDYATSTASEFYTSSAKKFTFTQSTNTAAYIDAGPVTIRGATASANGVTLTPPAGLSASYQLTLPAALPASTKIMTCDPSGNIGAVYDVDNSTLQVVSNVLSIKTLSTAPGTIGTSQIATGAVTPSCRSTAIAGISGSCGSYGTSSTTFVQIAACVLTLTTTGRPLIMSFGSDQSPSGANMVAISTSAVLAMCIDGSQFATFSLSNGASNQTALVALIPNPYSGGSHVFSMYVRVNSGSGVLDISNYALAVVEL